MHLRSPISLIFFLFYTLAIVTPQVWASALDPLTTEKTATTEKISQPALELNALNADWWKPLQPSHPSR